MANVGSWQPDRLDTIHYIHKLAESRMGEGYAVISGCDVTETAGTPDMNITVDAGEIFYNGNYVTVTGNAVAITAADGTNDRMDVIYINSAGTAVVHDGDVLAVSDPLGNTIWTQYEQPYPKAGCPSGTILALVHVPANDTAIGNAQIEDIAQYNVNKVISVSANVPYDDADNEVTIATIPASSIITSIAKIPGTAYDAGSVTVGIDGDEDTLMPAIVVDATGSDFETVNVNYGCSTKTTIKAFITPGAASQGTFTIILTYVTV